MKHFKKLLLAATVAMGCATGAHADTSGSLFVLMDAGSPGQFTNTWSFSDQSVGGSDDPFAAAHVAGAKFDDFFTFNVPDAENVSFTLDPLKKGNTPGVKFYDDNGNLVHSVSGGFGLLTSGVYTFEVAGMYSVNKGLYYGQLTGTPAVPEPAGWMMLFAGLAALAGVSRLRKNQA